MNRPVFHTRLALLALTLAAPGLQAHAQMSLTAGAVTAGFGLSTFATGFPSSSNIGPFGIAFDGSKVIVSDNPGNVRVFPNDSDGQSAASVTPGHTYALGNANDLVKANGHYYLSQYFADRIMEINADGTPYQIVANGITHPEGISAIPDSSHIFVAADQGILNVDPSNGKFTVVANIRADGLTTDGTTLYAAVSGGIQGYRISDNAPVFSITGINDGPDGAALGTGAMLSNKLFVNTNGGRLLEYNLTGTLVATVLGTGGSRGDYVTVDPNNGTLLLTQTDRILRLTAPQGNGFGSTPEPGAIALLLASGVTAAGLLRRRRKFTGKQPRS